jgi:hypothetical protein
VAALHGERERALFFDHHAGHRRDLFAKGLDDLFRLRVLYRAVDLAQAAGNAELFVDDDSFQSSFPMLARPP